MVYRYTTLWERRMYSPWSPWLVHVHPSDGANSQVATFQCGHHGPASSLAAWPAPLPFCTVPPVPPVPPVPRRLSGWSWNLWGIFKAKNAHKAVDAWMVVASSENLQLFPQNADRGRWTSGKRFECVRLMESQRCHGEFQMTQSPTRHAL